ncbi:hypothetical protein KJQ89_08065, partial [Campylobacter lari]|nr:hypothetical protein [Campylobacter lari]
IAISNPLGIKTYNATEGGARIEGSIEKPFNEVCKNLLKENKPLFEQIQGLSEKEIQDKKEEIGGRINQKVKKITNIIVESNNLYQNLKNTLLHIKHANTIQELNFKEILSINDDLHKLKTKIESTIELGEVLNPALKNIELKLAKISLTSAHTQEAKKVRMINWLLQHEIWLQKLIKFLKILLEILQKITHE